MALLSFLRKNTGPAPDPNPGEGGYTAARGPMGQTGYPGSSKQVRTDPPEAGGRLHDDYGGRHTGYGTDPNAANRADLVPGSYDPAGSPPPRGRRGQDRAWVPPEGQQADLQKDESEWFGGPNRHVGTSNLGPGDEPGQAMATERQVTLGFSAPSLGRGVPGNANQRNSKFYAGKQAAPDGENRYVFAGVNGGQTSYTFDRRMPYTGRGNGARGAQLNADRFYASTTDGEYFGDQGGQYGLARQAPDGQHRPTEYYEPGPWTENFYDTTASAGSPGEAGTGGQAPQMTYYSPSVAGRRRG